LFPAGLLVALAVGAGTGAVYGLTKLPLFRTGEHDRSMLAALVSGTGLLIFFAELVRLLQSSGPRYHPPALSDAFTLPIGTSFPVTLSGNDLLVVALTLAALLVTFRLYRRSLLGMWIRACADDRGMAAMVGIDPNRTIALALMLAGALAGLGGFLTLANYGVITPYMGWSMGLKALTAAVIGGVGSLRGAVLGAFLIAGLETFWSAWFALEYRDVIVFAVLIMALIFRPSGLFARPEPDRTPGVGGQGQR
jgi:branched-chain amino acid transport system permease protein